MQKKDFQFKNRDDKRILATVRTPDSGVKSGKSGASDKNGSKGTIILLHGLGGWKEQPLIVIIAEALCKNGYTVCTFDAADGAKGPDNDFVHGTTTGVVQDLDDVVGHVTNADWYTAPLILAGHSQGGLAALHYTRLHPSMVSKLVLLAPAVSWKSGKAMTLAGGLWWMLRNNAKTPGPDHNKKLPLDRAWLFDFMTFDGRKDAAYVSAPTLVVSASKDGAVMSPSAHYELGKYLTNGTVIVIPDARHIFWKHETKVADTIVKWLTSS